MFVVLSMPRPADFCGVGGEDGVPRIDEPALGCAHPTRGQRIEVAGTDAAVLDEPGTFQHPQVLAHSRPTYRQVLCQLSDRRGALVQ
jgi:hypothetical protein